MIRYYYLCLYLELSTYCQFLLIKDAFELDTCSNKWDEREKSSHVTLCWLFQSSSQVNNSNFVTNTLEDLLAAVCGHWTMQRTGHAFLQHFSAAATSNYFHRTDTVLRGEHRSRVAKGWNQGGFLTWFVFLCLFILGALTWQQADGRLWTGNCNRAKSAAKSQLKMPGTVPIYLCVVRQE